MTKIVLFLCTGNYYRSRFAESLFNAWAPKQGLNWRADSRGLALERGINNIGAISKYTAIGLAQRGVEMEKKIRYPLSATEADFIAANKVIAVDELEHRPLLASRFPQWVDAVEYWVVHDVGQTPVSFALQQIEQNLQQLLKRLQL